MQRTITILGSTGSIGTQTLQVVAGLPSEFTVRWITCNTRVDDLVRQVQEYNPYGIAIRDETACRRFRELLPTYTGEVRCGEEGLCEAAADPENNLVMSAMVGFSGVVPTMAAIQSGCTVALANKETLVSAGELITATLKEHNAALLAVDSEHSAIAQCLQGENLKSVQRIILTASGGPFRTATAEELATMTPAQALRHPNWDMGNKITIDSATLMNKGFEVIEARWLFNLDATAIDVVVHPQSIIHSMVEFCDGSVKAQMGLPSMLVPIQWALTYPQRTPMNMKTPDLAEIGALTFEKPDVHKFPCLQIAYDALRTGGTAGCIVNAANEIAVYAFLDNRIRFTDIPTVILKTLERMNITDAPSLPAIIETDAEARLRAHEQVTMISAGAAMS
ncbi:MAG: 1-deoxy-D-xylulose-5-phosphate reductoisomerase [Chlorobi bacterium]|nr:MAG: 1-deoxy-D-xylulose-5-phosphate reductoisomerase [Bacteroidota bacterium]KXK34887.1 MAG: 1-Deoxy-D-xylulose 5-phosphate reductoisomerase [Chlorobi bacterium OLB6]MBE2264936.1 1-deoxy-D-xylulose-5-phosphate reductoisomerase [Flavobacteriales bacterium]MBL1161601.1 1-deoxy-D-xylulose-5-phosphate reductoisomerase [Chlorobiota bacterium]MBW7854184.1 1-deoxy-D-xylulose-5-phosphate reductoisomerase [Candidatus Kapabacteria bacterium]MCC6332227.1 1-deoxy-D-xylulose-5-phosphate reductoisomerase